MNSSNKTTKTNPVSSANIAKKINIASWLLMTTGALTLLLYVLRQNISLTYDLVFGVLSIIAGYALLQRTKLGYILLHVMVGIWSVIAFIMFIGSIAALLLTRQAIETPLASWFGAPAVLLTVIVVSIPLLIGIGCIVIYLIKALRLLRRPEVQKIYYNRKKSQPKRK